MEIGICLIVKRPEEGKGIQNFENMERMEKPPVKASLNHPRQTHISSMNL